MRYIFETSCVFAKGEDIQDMVDQAREITQETYAEYADDAAPVWDYHVRYFRSKYKGRPCVYMVHSAIEYVWVKPKEDSCE